METRFLPDLLFYSKSVPLSCTLTLFAIYYLRNCSCTSAFLIQFQFYFSWSYLFRMYGAPFPSSSSSIAPQTAHRISHWWCAFLQCLRRHASLPNRASPWNHHVPDILLGLSNIKYRSIKLSSSMHRDSFTWSITRELYFQVNALAHPESQLSRPSKHFWSHSLCASVKLYWNAHLKS